VRIDAQRWIVIDSFESRRLPVAVRYLRSIDVDPAQIRLAIATHWHDDHVRGLDRLLAAVPGAQFAFPQVADPKTLVTLASEADEAAGQAEPEMQSVFAKILRVLRRNGRQAIPVGGRYMLRRDRRSMILALSPTAAAMNAGMTSAGREILRRPRPATKGGRAKATAIVKPNLTSLALWIETNSHAVLLGADLEAHERYGWPAAVRDARDLDLEPRGQLLKVPHHGSQNADHDCIWEHLLARAPYAAFTPYAPSRLPRETDIERLRSRPATVHGAASGGMAAKAVGSVRAAYPRAPLPNASRFGFVHYKAVRGGWSVDRGFCP
jgi:beta-lactamase superfamily II metal-dependent hydrolase